MTSTTAVTSTQPTGTLTGTTGSGTDTTSSTGTESGGVECEGPGCTACDVRPGEPQRLFGLTWNFDMGEPGTGLGLEELRCIVPETGATDLIAAIPGMDWLPQGSNTYDRDASVLYAIAFAEWDNIHRLFSIHTLTGELLANPPIEESFNWSGGLHIRADKTLVGVTWNPELLQEELRTIDPETAQTTLVAAIPEIQGLFQERAYDPQTDTIYLLGTAMGEEGIRLFIIDAATGELLGYPTIKGSPAWASLFVRNDGALLAVAAIDLPDYELLELDPQTAEFETLAPLPAIKGLLHGTTYDDLEDAFFLIGADHRLLQFDASTGELLSDPVLDKPKVDKDYNWSGQIHTR